MPTRFYYPLTEHSSNATNYAAAAATVTGGDNQNGKLFWMP
jgi:hypothetical protein